ncbi:MAG TPA: methyltransferase [Gaiellaceae bacterium]|jgi:release factor glutamine methyltransferase|nr:methyltransferase [Gaiellaceae bacterium]
MAATKTTPARFHGLLLETAPRLVFTPRPATERLVDAALVRLGPLAGAARVADVGTGTGAIAVSLAVRLPELEVWATETQAPALALARRNVEAHGLGGRVHVLAADLLEGVPTGLELVVANLPYLPPEAAIRFPDEPREAVVSDGDGLAHYRRLLAFAGDRLAPGGGVLLQFHGEVLEAERSELHWLETRLEALARAAA